eukprot:6209140-Pleurochrysis_carterae.AAC.2
MSSGLLFPSPPKHVAFNTVRRSVLFFERLVVVARQHAVVRDELCRVRVAQVHVAVPHAAARVRVQTLHRPMCAQGGVLARLPPPGPSEGSRRRACGALRSARAQPSTRRPPSARSPCSPRRRPRARSRSSRRRRRRRRRRHRRARSRRRAPRLLRGSTRRFERWPTVCKRCVLRCALHLRLAAPPLPSHLKTASEVGLSLKVKPATACLVFSSLRRTSLPILSSSRRRRIRSHSRACRGARPARGA